MGAGKIYTIIMQIKCSTLMKIRFSYLMASEGLGGTAERPSFDGYSSKIASSFRL